MQAHWLEFECYGKFSQITMQLDAARSARMRYCKIHVNRCGNRDAAGCTRFLPYKDVVQVEFHSTESCILSNGAPQIRSTVPFRPQRSPGVTREKWFGIY
jgi:hypothetical protein